MSNQKTLPIIAVTAVAAFGLGWAVKPSSQQTEGAPASGDQSQASHRSSPSSSRSGGVRLGSAQVTPEREFLREYLVDGEISAEGMRDAIKKIAQNNDPLMRQKMFAALLENLTAENAKDAFEALRENRRGGPGRGNDEELRLLANAWGRIDGPGAMAALKEMAEQSGNEDRGGRGGRGGRGPGGGPGGLSGEMMSVLTGWATVDGAGASAYLNGIEDDREKRYASFGVLQGMLVNGVDEALSFVQSLPEAEGDDRSKGMLMGMITSEMLEQGLDQAKGWVDSVQDPALRSGALARVAMEIMREDRQAAADWIAKYGNEEAAAPAVNRLADSWAREDPQAVLTWADNLSGQAKVEAYGQAMGSWAQADPEAAGAYLANLASSPERDAAVEGYATRVSREDPVAAMEWAKTISDAEVRKGAEIDVARDWYRNDQAAAQEWINAAGLSEQEVQSITAPRGGGFRGFDRARGPGQ